MTGHIVLCGLGKLGFSILEILRQQRVEVCVVTRDARPELLHRAEKMAARVILDDGREIETLRGACLESARALIIASSSDLINLDIALDARRLAPGLPIVLRMYDPQLTARVRKDLGLAAVLNAADLSAPAFVAAALGEQVLRTFEVEDQTIDILSVPIDEPMSLDEAAARFRVIPLAVRSNGELVFAPPMETPLHKGDEVVCAATAEAIRDVDRRGSRVARAGGRKRASHRWVHMDRVPFGIVGRIWKNAIPGLRIAVMALLGLMAAGIAVFHFAMGLTWLDALYFTVTIVTTVGFGDFNLANAHPAVKLFGTGLMLSGVALLLVIYSIITDYLVRQRVEQILGARGTTLENHVVVVGLGSVGYRVAQRLHQLGESVAAIERNEDSEMAARMRELIPVLYGEGGSEKLLLRAGVDRARAVVAAVDDDLTNLRIAHLAELLNPKVRTIVRLFQSSLAEKMELCVLGVDQPLDPDRAAGATFAASALAPNTLQGFTLDNNLLLLRERKVSELSDLPAPTVADLRSATAVPVIRREESGFKALSGNDSLRPNDILLIVERFTAG